MGELPVIERQCIHNSKKVIRREIYEGYFITSVDLCSKCKDSLEFLKNIEYVDKEIQPRPKLKTKSEIKKTITKRKKEITLLKTEMKNLWEIQDTMKKAPKLIEGYIALGILYVELETSYEKYIKKLESKS